MVVKYRFVRFSRKTSDSGRRARYEALPREKDTDDYFSMAWHIFHAATIYSIAFQVAYVSRLATYITDLTINHTCAIFNPFNLLHYSTYIQWYDLFFALGVPSTIPLRCFRSLDRSLIDFFFLSLLERRKAGLVFESWDSNPCPLPHHFSTLLATVSRAFSFRFQPCCVHRISYFKSLFSIFLYNSYIQSICSSLCTAINAKICTV